MRKIDQLLLQYGDSHQNDTNKLIHWICVPAIMFSLVGLIMQIPFIGEKSVWYNWAGILLLAALIYYVRLSTTMFAGFVLIALILLYGNWALIGSATKAGINPVWVSLAIFVIAWIGQFIGHKIEGKKPSFLDDIQFLLIGPAWLMHFIFKKLGIQY